MHLVDFKIQIQKVYKMHIFGVAFLLFVLKISAGKGAVNNLVICIVFLARKILRRLNFGLELNPINRKI